MRSTLNRRHPTGSVPRYSELGLTGAAGIRRRSTCRCSSNCCKGSPTTSTLSPRSSRSAPSTSSNIDGRWRAGQGLQGIQVNVPREAVAFTEATCPVQRPAAPASRPHLHPFSPSRAGRSRGASRFPRRHGLPELEGLWVSLLIMLTRSLAGRDSKGTDTAPARWLQAQRFIRANLANPNLSPTTIADALHISRSTLYATLSPTPTGSQQKSNANASRAPTRSSATALPLVRWSARRSRGVTALDRSTPVALACEGKVS
jgi:hypothetical protein